MCSVATKLRRLALCAFIICSFGVYIGKLRVNYFVGNNKSLNFKNGLNTNSDIAKV